MEYLSNSPQRRSPAASQQLSFSSVGNVASFKNITGMLKNEFGSVRRNTGSSDYSKQFFGEQQVMNINEKESLRELNDRFAGFIDKVRHLENHNKMLEKEIEDMKQKKPSSSSLSDEYEPEIQELRKVVHEINVKKRQIEVERQHLEQDFYILRSKYEEEARSRSETENSIVTLKRDINDAHLSKLELERKAQSLGEEIIFLKKQHQEEVSEMTAQIQEARVNVEMKDFGEADITAALRDIRNQLEGHASSDIQKTEDFFQDRVAKLTKAAEINKEALDATKQEIYDHRKQLQRKRVELETVKSTKEALEKQLCDLEERHDAEINNYQSTIGQLEQELKHTKFEMSSHLREYQDLLNVKMALDVEIASYRKLLESEETRLSSSSSSQISGPYVYRQSHVYTLPSFTKQRSKTSRAEPQYKFVEEIITEITKEIEMSEMEETRSEGDANEGQQEVSEEKGDAEKAAEAGPTPEEENVPESQEKQEETLPEAEDEEETAVGEEDEGKKEEAEGKPDLGPESEVLELADNVPEQKTEVEGTEERTEESHDATVTLEDVKEVVEEIADMDISGSLKAEAKVSEEEVTEKIHVEPQQISTDSFADKEEEELLRTDILVVEKPQEVESKKEAGESCPDSLPKKKEEEERITPDEQRYEEEAQSTETGSTEQQSQDPDQSQDREIPKASEKVVEKRITPDEQRYEEEAQSTETGSTEQQSQDPDQSQDREIPKASEKVVEKRITPDEQRYEEEAQSTETGSTEQQSQDPDQSQDREIPKPSEKVVEKRTTPDEQRYEEEAQSTETGSTEQQSQDPDQSQDREIPKPSEKVVEKRITPDEQRYEEEAQSTETGSTEQQSQDPDQSQDREIPKPSEKVVEKIITPDEQRYEEEAQSTETGSTEQQSQDPDQSQDREIPKPSEKVVEKRITPDEQRYEEEAQSTETGSTEQQSQDPDQSQDREIPKPSEKVVEKRITPDEQRYEEEAQSTETGSTEQQSQDPDQSQDREIPKASEKVVEKRITPDEQRYEEEAQSTETGSTEQQSQDPDQSQDREIPKPNEKEVEKRITPDEQRYEEEAQSTETGSTEQQSQDPDQSQDRETPKPNEKEEEKIPVAKLELTDSTIKEIEVPVHSQEISDAETLKSLTETPLVTAGESKDPLMKDEASPLKSEERETTAAIPSPGEKQEPTVLLKEESVGDTEPEESSDAVKDEGEEKEAVRGPGDAQLQKDLAAKDEEKALIPTLDVTPPPQEEKRAASPKEADAGTGQDQSTKAETEVKAVPKSETPEEVKEEPKVQDVTKITEIKEEITKDESQVKLERAAEVPTQKRAEDANKSSEEMKGQELMVSLSGIEVKKDPEPELKKIAPKLEENGFNVGTGEEKTGTEVPKTEVTVMDGKAEPINEKQAEPTASQQHI